jgi:hypothetical protein
MQLSAGPKPETAKDELSSSKNKKPSSRNSSPTHRSAAIFALMEGGKRQPTFAVRRLENDPAYLALEQRDRSFARLLITTTERRMGQIDQVLEEFMTKSNQFRKVRIHSLPSKRGEPLFFMRTHVHLMFPTTHLFLFLFLLLLMTMHGMYIEFFYMIDSHDHRICWFKLVYEWVPHSSCLWTSQNTPF